MVELEAHGHPTATIFDGGGVNWKRGSPFRVILVPSSLSSSATESVSYGGDLGGFASLLAVSNSIREVNCRTGPVGSEISFWIVSKVC